jgi:hypothetical protein
LVIVIVIVGCEHEPEAVVLVIMVPGVDSDWLVFGTTDGAGVVETNGTGVVEASGLTPVVTAEGGMLPEGVKGIPGEKLREDEGTVVV